MIKSTINHNTVVVTTKLKEIFLGGLVVCSLGGESWDGEKEEEIGEERVGKVVIY